MVLLVLECGGKVYNEETHTCCSDTLVEIASKYECCGGDVIDTSYYECDRGIVFDTKVPNRECSHNMSSISAVFKHAISTA